jgi:hypothetical protein
MLVDPYVLPRRLLTNKTCGCVRSALRGRYGIGPMPTPGMTAAKTAQSQPSAPKQTVLLERFEKVDRACWLETAPGARSTEKRQHRRNRYLVSANQKTHEREHQGARIEARSARCNHSSFSARYGARAAAGRAIRTHQKPSRNLPCSLRTMSRSRRRRRFRTTAPPILFEVTKPARKDFSSFRASTPSTSVRPLCAVPSDLTRANSPGRSKRFAFEKVKFGGFGACGMIPIIPQRTLEAPIDLHRLDRTANFPWQCHGKTSDQNL